MSSGEISGKWNLKHNYFKNLDDTTLPTLVASERNVILKYAAILSLFVAVIFLKV